jgi:hypothetical protein
VREYRFWHIRMAHDIVQGPQQLITFEATDADEGIITVCDGAMRIRSRDQALSRVEITLSRSHRAIVFHRVKPRNQFSVIAKSHHQKLFWHSG